MHTNSDTTNGSSIKQIFNQIDTRPLFAAEQAMDALVTGDFSPVDKQARKLLNVFGRSALAAAEVDDAQYQANPIDALFAPSLLFWQKEIIAVMLLRLFAKYEHLTAVQEVTLRAAALFDEVFEQNIYRLARIDRGTQSYAKFDGLKRLVISVEQEIETVVNSIQRLDDLGAFKQAFLKKINGGLARKLVHPFVPEHLRDQRLVSLLNATERFLALEGASIIDAYHQLVSGLNGYIDAASAVRTQYAELYFGDLARRLKTFVDRQFNSTPFSKPSNIRIIPSEKKYAFSRIGSEFELFVEVVNDGPGFAFGVDLSVTSNTDNLYIQKPELHLGGIELGTIQVGIPIKVQHLSDPTLAEIKCDWRNFDGSKDSSTAIIDFPSQRSDVDWDRARTEDPYSLAAVSSVSELVGRDEILNHLIALTTGPNVESAFIRGQRRVGKTSIVRALSNHLKGQFDRDYVIVFLEAGDYVAEDARTTIQFLGRKLCRSIKRADARFAALEIPTFEGALSPIIDFLEDAQTIAPSCRMLFILDEFDDLPLELYRRGLSGDAFFRTLRSISNKPEYGFILVGSEKMEYVLSCQGDALNKFTSIPVDYFDKRTHWADFQNLVRHPAHLYLDYSDSSIAAIYDECAGNPYFAKLICKSLFSIMVERRDCHVTQRDVRQAIDRTLSQVEATSFQHFWIDGIHEAGTRAEEISILRRRVLLSLAECLRSSERATRDGIVGRAHSYPLQPFQVDIELRDLERRRVLLCYDATYSCKVALFGQWLETRGYQEILATFVDHETASGFRRQRETDRVRDEEIVTMLAGWGLYLGRRIATEDVRAWLDQFRDESARRLMFDLLISMRFYSGDRIRQKLHEAHRIVGRAVVWQRKKLQPKRRDLIVTALGGLAHSGSEYARRYADENMIYPENVVAPGDLEEALSRRSGVQALVLVDDFVGTGQTLAQQLKSSGDLFKSALRGGIKHIFLIVCVGFASGQAVIETAISGIDLPIIVHFCDGLSERDKLFSDVSAAYPDSSKRMRAKDIAYEYGVSLVSDAPLGYGDTQAAVVFENKIPNNCPPILWKEGKSWIPLLRRT